MNVIFLGLKQRETRGIDLDQSVVTLVIFVGHLPAVFSAWSIHCRWSNPEA